MTTAPLLTSQRILALWAPLALTWCMMAAEGPILQSQLSRLPEPTLNLAAFGVAISIAFIIEAPIIMLLSASTAYAKGPHSYRSLRRFALTLSGAVSITMAILLIPPVWELISETLLNLPTNIKARVYWCLVALIPWPCVIGIRRFYQGIIIRTHSTRLITVGTVFRLTSIIVGCITIVLLMKEASYSAVAGSAVLSAAVTIEMLATVLMARDSVRQIRGAPQADTPLSQREIARLYLPLALTSVITMGIGPLLTAFMSHSTAAVESLAVYPVVDGVVFQFRGLLFAYQEVAIALAGKSSQEDALVIGTGYRIAAVATIALACVAFTPLASIVYGIVPFSLSSDLVSYATNATQILLPMPFLSAVYSINRGFLIASGSGTVITYSTILEALGTVVLLVAFWFAVPGYPGIYGVCWGIVLGKVAAALYLERQLRLHHALRWAKAV